jgi:hypothetical protein
LRINRIKVILIFLTKHIISRHAVIHQIIDIGYIDTKRNTSVLVGRGSGAFELNGKPKVCVGTVSLYFANKVDTLVPLIFVAKFNNSSEKRDSSFWRDNDPRSSFAEFSANSSG